MTYTVIQYRAAALLGVRPGSVNTCWIAAVKRERGETRSPAPNRGRGVPPCPAEYRAAILQVLNHRRPASLACTEPAPGPMRTDASSIVRSVGGEGLRVTRGTRLAAAT